MDLEVLVELAGVPCSKLTQIAVLALCYICYRIFEMNASEIVWAPTTKKQTNLPK